MAGQIKVDEECFQCPDGSQNPDVEALLDCIRNRSDLSTLEAKLDKLFAPFKSKDGSVPEDTPWKIRKARREKRIKLYDNLLLLALNAENDDLNDWFKNGDATDLCMDTAYSELIPGSFYTYLLDQIHEDEEIMFKFYRADNGLDKPIEWRKKALWLVESIRRYRFHVVRPVLTLMKGWDDENKELYKQLLTEAKGVFNETLSSLHRRNFKSERNWRNRARLYWLLGLSRNAAISKGTIGKFKNLEYAGPISLLLLQMIQEDEDMLLEKSIDKPRALPLLQICKEKYGEEQKQLPLGHIKVDGLLAWASAANDRDLVKIVLEHYSKCMSLRPDCDYIWEKSMRESWAKALWNASYKGHARIVEELLSCKLPYHLYYSEYFSGKKIEPPLHVAVQRRHISVVDVFCSAASKRFNCHEENSDELTPLEVGTCLNDLDSKKATTEKDASIKRRIQGLLLQRREVKEAVDESSKQRQLAVDSANAIMVGGTLIAGITFAGWLQPPLGYNSYYQFVETAPAAPRDSYESYMSIQGNITIQVFAISNSLSFFLAIAAVIAGMETTCSIKAIEDTYMTKSVKKLQSKLKWETSLFIASVLCVLVAFASAGIAILPPIKHYQTSMYITIAIGGFICVVFICKMLWYCLRKTSRNWVKSQFVKLFDKLKQKLSQTNCTCPHNGEN